ncbi:MAG TPA: hypothetical protein VGR53_11290 [Nitrososphaerales archaeon]|nr:hypothetical protein [Nitrososphaerales archaeon]
MRSEILIFVKRLVKIGIITVTTFAAVLFTPAIPSTEAAFWVIPAIHHCYATPAGLQFASQRVGIFASASYEVFGTGPIFVPASNLTGNMLEFMPLNFPTLICG